ncbi:MAG TPA: LapA family protein [Solirubrobacteraceae bacterium]|nr:LapA family protein [Solirubrobacteraceae bacterium]
MERKQRMRLAVAGILGALVTLFGVLNVDEVDVNWILGTWSTPLIVVIVLCLAAGMAIDRALVRRSSSSRRAGR